MRSCAPGRPYPSSLRNGAPVRCGAARRRVTRVTHLPRPSPATREDTMRRQLRSQLLVALASVCVGGPPAFAQGPVHSLVWESGFENGQGPPEWSAYDNGSWSPDGSMPPGRTSAWTIVDRSSGEPVHEGDHAYRGWIVGSANESHRAYPGISAGPGQHLPATIAAPFVNTFAVWLDLDWSRLAPTDWVHFGTWSNDPDWCVHTMSVRDGRLEFAHAVPFSGEWIGPTPRPEFPLRRWVRLTVYVEYDGETGFVQAWQDGVAVLRADLAQCRGDRLYHAHWGMYANGAVADAVQYNDSFKIWTLDRKLTPEELTSEPLPAPEPGPAVSASAALLGLAAASRVAPRARRA